MPKRKLPPNQEVIDMYQSGMSTGEIAEKCNVKPVTVCSLLSRLNVVMRNPKEAAVLRTKNGRCKAVKYWLGKKQPRDMVEKRISKIRGSKHYLWKGGNNKRPYRNVVKKEICSECGSRLNLCIHHIDYDHYSNHPDNLQVLCVSCHLSLHKQSYWDAIHQGKTPPKSNGKVGWIKK